MGQKVNPIGLRVGINRTWDSRWYAGSKGFADQLHADLRLREWLKNRLKQAGMSKVLIERPTGKALINLHVARPGLVIGKKGADIEKLRRELNRMMACDVSLNIVEIRKPDMEAKLVAEGIAQQLERRVAFRRAMKRAVQNTMRAGAEGVKVICGGRLGGAEIARVERYHEGRVPLHTLRGEIDYATAEAHTTYGICGVKVWIFKGEVLTPGGRDEDKSRPAAN